MTKSQATDKFSALLHEKWWAGSDPDQITGTWAEDGSWYEIRCPHQLRDLLIEMQNRLCGRAKGIEELRRKLRESEHKFVTVFGGDE